MKILFISRNMVAADLARTLKKEGHAVRLFIQDKKSRSNLDNIVKKTDDWKKDLKWVGKDGLIIVDDVGYGKTFDRLRKKGYLILGGSELSDKLEIDREYGQKIFKECGLKTVDLKDFDDMDDAVNYIKRNPAAWVIKQNDHGSKSLNYIGHFKDGKDAVSVLKNYLQNKNLEREKVTLHKRIYGVEIGVGRYFNGTEWVGPIELNVEHKMLFPGELGPSTTEMGTLAWYDNNENNKLFKESLDKLKPHLQKINFKGDMEINLIVNKKNIYPLEATPRFGSPIIHLHREIHTSPWGTFLYDLAKGNKHKIRWEKGYGIVILIATEPFPYSNHGLYKSNNLYGSKIYFEKISKKDQDHIHLEDVSNRLGHEEKFYISGKDGYILYVTGIGKTIKEAREKVYKLAKKIIIPKSFYRTDIGIEFEKYGIKKLKEWGWL